MLQPPLRIRHLYVSPGHNYFGHHGKPPGESPTLEVPEVRCVPGSGIEGDRFFDFKDDYQGTDHVLLAGGVRAAGRGVESAHDKSPAVFRRNVVCEGVDLNTR